MQSASPIRFTVQAYHQPTTLLNCIFCYLLDLPTVAPAQLSLKTQTVKYPQVHIMIHLVSDSCINTEGKVHLVSVLLIGHFVLLWRMVDCGSFPQAVMHMWHCRRFGRLKQTNASSARSTPRLSVSDFSNFIVSFAKIAVEHICCVVQQRSCLLLAVPT